ncbi:leucine-rich_repeat domain-containing protein [Hexamita inflata]|uniref:Leucine-rich repeat domain-containing protein n=1 Tax=Hexamita inflata TaxID=28002 RepID=A0AA86ULD1_9EUKA|nr:leucine-rich repeat domain-containing protein [Hexamita inflata]
MLKKYSILTELNQNNCLSEQEIALDEKIAKKYLNQIRNDQLNIGNLHNGDPELTSLKFIETLNIKKLNLINNINMILKLNSSSITKLFIQITQYNIAQKEWTVNDLEIENLEDLSLIDCNLVNHQILNISKFRKLKVLDLSANYLDLTYVYKLTNLTKLSMCRCGLKYIDQIVSLLYLEELDLSENYGIDISPLKYLVKLTFLELCKCNIISVQALRPLVNLEWLNLSYNKIVFLDRYELHGMKKLKYLNLKSNYITNFMIIGKHPCDLLQIINMKNSQQLSTDTQQWIASQIFYVEDSSFVHRNIFNKHKLLKLKSERVKQQLHTLIHHQLITHIMLVQKVVNIFQLLNKQEIYE